MAQIQTLRGLCAGILALESGVIQKLHFQKRILDPAFLQELFPFPRREKHALFCVTLHASPYLAPGCSLARFPLLVWGDTRKQKSSSGCVIRRSRGGGACARMGRGRRQANETASLLPCKRHVRHAFRASCKRCGKARELAGRRGCMEMPLGCAAFRMPPEGLRSPGRQAAFFGKSVNLGREKSSLRIGGF